jgi:uncharacterized protein with predicted RNA binding PUA domain
MGSKSELNAVRMMADYQFGSGCGKALFPDSCEFVVSSKGKVRQVIDDVRIATVKADSGWLTISIKGAKRLHSFLPYPSLRVVVMNEVSEFIKDGGNVFAKHVVDVDPSIRAGDEIIVVDEEDNLLATGKAILSSKEMLELSRGMAVSVRWGISKNKGGVEDED